MDILYLLEVINMIETLQEIVKTDDLKTLYDILDRLDDEQNLTNTEKEVLSSVVQDKIRLVRILSYYLN